MVWGVWAISCVSHSQSQDCVKTEFFELTPDEYDNFAKFDKKWQIIIKDLPLNSPRLICVFGVWSAQAVWPRLKKLTECVWVYVRVSVCASGEKQRHTWFEDLMGCLLWWHISLRGLRQGHCWSRAWRNDHITLKGVRRPSVTLTLSRPGLRLKNCVLKGLWRNILKKSLIIEWSPSVFCLPGCRFEMFLEFFCKSD